MIRPLRNHLLGPSAGEGEPEPLPLELSLLGQLQGVDPVEEARVGALLGRCEARLVARLADLERTLGTGRLRQTVAEYLADVREAKARRMGALVN